MPLADRDLLRYSLVLVWLLTAICSVWELEGQSRALLLAGGITDPFSADVLVWSGAAVDLILGLLLWWKPGHRVCYAALFVMMIMTVVATLLTPALWLHPLGPLSKNLPIAAILIVLARTSK
ncbi:MAG: DoxX-like family protein [Rhodoferax sp.]|nr:DoxX-like family protein [Rhodoferax sp.]